MISMDNVDAARHILHISNLPDAITHVNLWEAMALAGPVASLTLPPATPNGDGRIALVEFQDVNGVEAALARYQGRHVLGRPLRLSRVFSNGLRYPRRYQLPETVLFHVFEYTPVAMRAILSRMELQLSAEQSNITAAPPVPAEGNYVVDVHLGSNNPPIGEGVDADDRGPVARNDAAACLVAALLPKTEPHTEAMAASNSAPTSSTSSRRRRQDRAMYVIPARRV